MLLLLLWAVIGQQPFGYQIAKIYSDFAQDLALVLDDFDALGLEGTSPLYAA